MHSYGFVATTIRMPKIRASHFNILPFFFSCCLAMCLYGCLIYAHSGTRIHMMPSLSIVAAGWRLGTSGNTVFALLVSNSTTQSKSTRDIRDTLTYTKHKMKADMPKCRLCVGVGLVLLLSMHSFDVWIDCAYVSQTENVKMQWHSWILAILLQSYSCKLMRFHSFVANGTNRSN